MHNAIGYTLLLHVGCHLVCASTISALMFTGWINIIPCEPGRDHLDQIKTIIAILGTPREDLLQTRAG
eukprot:1339263-Amphidinium_carterae.1